MIAQFLYRNPRILALVVCVVGVAGVSSFVDMPRLEDPVLGKRVAVISTIFPGADSRRVESLVTVPLERRLRGIGDIDQVRSTSRTGISNIVIRLGDEVTDVEPVWSLIRDRLNDVEGELPEGCFRPKIDVFQLKAFAAIAAVKCRISPPNPTILRRLAGQLSNRIGRLSGTESVHLFGDSGEEYVAQIEAADLVAFNLSTAGVASQVAAGNVTHPAGYLRSPDSELLLDLDAAQTAKSLEESIIRLVSGGRSVTLGEIATVTKSLVAPADLALVDGQQAIVIGAFVDDRLRVNRWSADFHQVIADFQSEYQAEVVAEVIFSQNEYITARLAALLQNLLFGGCAVLAVVFLLMGWRSMIVVGATLPLSALMVLCGMRVMQIPLHQMSVTGLIVALGLLIDNAIVIVEDIRSRILVGAIAARAVVEGIRHLAMPLFGSTLTTTLAFLPIATLPGPPGEFVGTIAISVILAIGSSFLLSMTVVPALLAIMRFDAGTGLAGFGLRNRSVERVYRRSLHAAFRFPLLGVLVGCVLPAAGFLAVGDLAEQFFPPSDRNHIQIEIELPARETAEKTLATVEAMQQTVAADPQVQRIHWFVGGSAPTFYYNVVPRRLGTPFYAQAIVELEPGGDAQHTTRVLQTQLDSSHPECRVVVRQLEQGPPFDAPIEVRVQGPDLTQLQLLGSQLRLLLSETSHVIHTRSDCEETIPKLVVNVDPRDAAGAGFSETDIVRFIYTTLEGAPAGKILDGEEELSVRIKMASREDDRLMQLAALQLPVPLRQPPNSPAGSRTLAATAPSLAAIADFELSSDIGAIIRIDGQRTNEIKAYIRAGVLPSAVFAEFSRRLAESDFRLPLGYSLEFGGERAERADAVNSLIANAVLLFALMILTLVISFRSFRHALIILVVGGLAIGLGPLALWLFGFPFGFMAVVGTMGLVGVAINDSIVVLAAIRDNRMAQGGDLSQLTDVVSGCTRHVVATTMTTIVGFAPLILAGGGFWPPLAIAIAGGVGGATILALYSVPSLNLLLHRH